MTSEHLRSNALILKNIKIKDRALVAFVYLRIKYINEINKKTTFRGRLTDV